MLTWLTSNQESRVTSYSVRNDFDVPPTPTSPSFGNQRRATGLSNVPAASGFGTQNFAAFKVLPIDPRGETSVELSDEMHSASSCRNAVDLIVDKIYSACEDMGGTRFVTEEDVVRFVS